MSDWNINKLTRAIKKAILIDRMKNYEFYAAKIYRKDNMDRKFYIYILASKKDGVLYIGVTSDLITRISQHKNKHADGFTKKYNVDKLVHYEIFEDPENAIHREKRLKKYTRDAKIKLIEKANPDWQDLYNQIIEEPSQGHPRIATQFG